MSNKEKAIMAIYRVLFIVFVGMTLEASRCPIMQAIGFVATLGTFLVFIIG